MKEGSFSLCADRTRTLNVQRGAGRRGSPAVAVSLPLPLLLLLGAGERGGRQDGRLGHDDGAGDAAERRARGRRNRVLPETELGSQSREQPRFLNGSTGTT